VFVSNLKHELTLINFSFLESINNIDGANSRSKVLTKNFALTLSMHSKNESSIYFFLRIWNSSIILMNWWVIIDCSYTTFDHMWRDYLSLAITRIDTVNAFQN